MIEDIKIVCGDYMQVHMWNSRPKAAGRRSRVGTSSDAQKRLNAKRAESKLRVLIHENFGRGDYAVRLDYARMREKLGRNPSEEEARHEMEKYLRRLRRLYRVAGKEMRWLYVTEVGRKSGKVHHHMLISGGIERDEIERQWKAGYGNTERLQFCETGLRGLVHYIVKEPITRRRWACSRNLRRPVEDRGVDRVRVKDAKYIDAHPDDVRYIDRLFPGYVAVDVENTPTAAGAFGMFMTIWLYRRDTRLF